jgi:hypothetical protein
MDTVYKSDWDQARRHLEAFWAHDALDRAAIGVTAPRHKAIAGPPAPPAPDDLTSRWTDAEYRVAAAEAGFRGTFFGGEALPNCWVNLGPGILATYLGSEPTFAETTVWFGELSNFDWLEPPPFDTASHWWHVTKSLTQAAVGAFGDRALVGVTDLGGGSDVLASLRGTDNLLMDLVLNPEPIERWMDALVDRWIQAFDELYAITSGPFGGSIQWLALWGPGRMYNIQSDFCCMVSPEMFERFIAPELEKLCRFLDSSLYHLDGPGALQHLDRLLAIPELDGIQWTPGAGVAPSVGWLPMLEKVQKAGKCLHIHDAIENAERILRTLKPEGVFLQTSAPTEKAARELLERATAWAAGPRW